MCYSRRERGNKLKISYRIIPGILFATLLMAGVSHARSAQDHPSATEQDAKSSAAPNAAKEHGPEGAQETKEAHAEEGHGNEQFKYSGAVRTIAKWTNIEVEHAYWLSTLFNFLVVVGILGWAGFKFLPGMFRDRTAAIQRAMQEAQKASEEARRKLAEIESRLQKLDVEIGMMRDAAEKEGAAEEARIQAAAQHDARKIVATAEQEIAAAAKVARRQLTAYAADLAVGLAQKQIHVDPATDQGLVRNFASQLTAAPESPRKDGN